MFLEQDNNIEFTRTLEIEFKKNANPLIAKGQKAYMKNKFDFYGIKAPVRQQIQKPFFQKKYLPLKKDLNIIIKTLWEKPQREYQYFSQELAYKYIKRQEKHDIELYEFMIEQKSWWDTVDFIATKLVGTFFKKYPDYKDKYLEKWISSNNIWLQRTALLFQLHYKSETDTILLSYLINLLLDSTDFFINKAIGWILRQYGKTNPDWVVDFVNKTPLNNLSRKEALRLIDIKQI